MDLLGLFGPRARWGSWLVTLNADQAPVPLTVFISGSDFDRGLGCFGLGCARPIVGRFCTRRDRYTVVACARFRCDRWGTCSAGARQILVRFRVWSGYRWWDRRQSCEICTCTLVLMTKISFFIFCFVPNPCCSLVVLCHVMLAINCTELNWIEIECRRWSIFTLKYFFRWKARQKAHNTLIVVNRYLSPTGERATLDSAQPHL